MGLPEDHADGWPAGPQERFTIHRRLGAGGMGVVCLAFDHARNAEVALKRLRRVDAIDIYRFKKEFRALADIAHPNLVTLYELHTVDEDWFFTMELVEGASFIEHVRPHAALEQLAHTISDTDATRTGMLAPAAAALATTASPETSSRLLRQRIIDAALMPERFEPAFYQLVDGVHALHLAGKLHRDLKPSNVLVEPNGRVVLLDFGLVADLAGGRVAASAAATAADVVAGTPAYMSPEQAADRPLTEASDWYSVGVMLHEALTGRRPFEGSGAEILAAKRSAEAPPPRLLCPDVPPRLDALCSALLRRDPAERPGGAAIYAAIGRAPSGPTLNLAGVAPPFVGREAELAALRRAFADSRRDHGVAVFVRGASGMGKSALIRHFLDQLAASDDPILLEGRCYERESVPYKALDTIVDALTGHLVQLDDAALAEVLPRDVALLARLFPVLRRVPAIASPAVPQLQPVDPIELRRRGFSALRSLLERLALGRPVVIAIDDLQWGDADSATFLADLIHHPKAPPLLLIASHRSEEEASNTVLATIRRGGAAEGAVRDLDVGALSDEEAMALLAEVGRDSADTSRSRAIVRDCAGSPFFLTELGRGRGAGDVADAGHLDGVLQRHVARLPDDARALLQVCAVAARPLATDLALRAAGLQREGAAVATLRVERLVRVRSGSTGRPSQRIEPYHDRIREAVAAALDAPTRRGLHLALARALEAQSEPDHEALVEHWLEAGHPQRAGHHAALAAAAAEETLAFRRAARLYALALAHGEAADAERRAMRTRMGHALVHAGALEEAADAFGAAAEGASPEESLDLRRLELEQRLRAGLLDQSMPAMRALLAQVGFRMPTSRAGTIAGIVVQELLLELHSEKLKTKRNAQLTPFDDRRMHVLFSISSGLAFVNPVMARLVHDRLLRDALASGHPRHVAMGTALHFGYVAVGGGEKAWRRSEQMRERAMALATELGDDALLGITLAGTGMPAYLQGRWAVARARFEQAESILRVRATDVRWALDLLEIFYTATLWCLGDTRELVRLVPRYLRDAQERGDRLSERGLRSWRSNAAWLVLGRPDEAEANVDAMVPARQPGEAFQLAHYYEMVARGNIALYRGGAPTAAAHARVVATWPDLERSLLLKVQSVRIEGWYLRGRCALAAASATADSGGDPQPYLKDVEKAAKRIQREEAPWGAPQVAMLRATAAHARGDLARTRDHLEAAAAGFAAADMALFAAVARRRLGALIGGEAGAAMVAEATAFMEHGQIADPAAITAMLAPGW